MIINAENMTALQQVINTAFQAGMQVMPKLNLDFLTTPFPSTGLLNLYPFMEDVGKWREWLGDRVWGNLAFRSFSVTNRDWEKSYRLPKKSIEDDQYATFPPMIQIAASGWPALRNTIRMDVITGNSKCWDDKALLATDHALGDNTIANLVTDALSKTTFETAFLTASAWKFANDEPCETVFSHLLVGEKLRAMMPWIKANKLVDKSRN